MLLIAVKLLAFAPRECQHEVHCFVAVTPGLADLVLENSFGKRLCRQKLAGQLLHLHHGIPKGHVGRTSGQLWKNALQMNKSFGSAKGTRLGEAAHKRVLKGAG